MMSVFNKRREFVRFILVGVLATATHYGIYFFLCVLMLPAIAYTIGYAISFILNFTFESIHGSGQPQSGLWPSCVLQTVPKKVFP